MYLSIISNLINLIKINIFILFLKLKKKKIIFFYHPKKKLTFIHNFYIEYLFEDYPKNYHIIFGHETNSKIGKDYFYIKQGYLKFLYFVDFFISNNICDVFPVNSKKIYIHHNLYDDPWVPKNKEEEMCKRLTKYNLILVATNNSVIKVNEMFSRYNLKFKPTIKEAGYAKLDYLLNDLKNYNYQKESILIAPTAINGFIELSIIDKIEKIIDDILTENKSSVILRPHPSDREDVKYLNLKNKFEKNSNFLFDTSENYFDTYSKAKVMITDMSGTAYTFAFLTLSPVIFLSVNEKKILENKYNNFNFYKDRNKIGEIVTDEKEISKTIDRINKNYTTYKDNITEIRSKMKYLNKSKNEIKNLIINLNW